MSLIINVTSANKGDDCIVPRNGAITDYRMFIFDIF